jgi:hypothetical protein
VNFSAYLDESGTHGGSPITLMSAVLGSDRQWQNFEKVFTKMKRRYGFSIFHAKDYKDTDGEFASWSRETKHRFANEFCDLIDSTFGASIVAHLRNDEYNQHYLTHDRPRNARWDTKYAICFRATLSMLLWEMDKREHRSKPNRLNIVIERGAKNAGDAVRIFNWIKDQAAPDLAALVGTLTFDGKKDCAPLAAADFLAYSNNMYEVDLLKPEPQRRLMSESNELKSNIWRVAIGSEQLKGLREQALLSHGARLRRVNPVLLAEEQT